MRCVSAEPSGHSFIDIGSGKGRVLFMAAQLGFRHVIGIEVSETLHRTAERNLQRFMSKTRSPARIELINRDAQDSPFPAEPSVIFMFNPFDEVVMTKVIENLETSLQATPRRTLLVYVHPTAESIVKLSGRLHKVFEDRGRDDFVVYEAERQKRTRPSTRAGT